MMVLFMATNINNVSSKYQRDTKNGSSLEIAIVEVAIYNIVITILILL